VPLPVGIGWVPFELVSLDGCRPETAPDGTPGRCLSLQFRQLSVMPARYRLDTRVEFGYDEVGHAFLREGWSDPEDWGVWALGTGAAIELPLDHRPTHDLRLRLDGYWYIQPGQAPLEMALLANGRVVEERTIPLGERDNPSFRIPASAIGEDARLRLELRFDNPASPAAIGQSDTRVLGLALRALRLFEEP
jgi:hypothetical protein